tara:strand:+ start:166 stop:735 length:570 start_codon:yes stop_codon:yes gene_type:complete
MIKKINKGFTLVELVIAMLISSFVMGGLVYVVSEANFYLKRQLYRDSINKYADQVFNDIFTHAINAELVSIDNRNRIVFGYKGSSGRIDSLFVYEKKRHKGIFLNGELLRHATFYSKDEDEKFYMVIKEFTSKYTLDIIGVSDSIKDAVIDILLGVELHYNRGDRRIVEEFPYKKTIFKRASTIFNSNQ